MSDAAVVAMAVLAWAAALVPLPVPWALGLAVAAAARLGHRTGWLIVGVTMLAAGLSWTAVDGLRAAPTDSATGWATLIDDPEPKYGGVRVRVRLHGRHLEASARGVPAAELRARLGGERVLVAGVVRPLGGRAAQHLAARHVVARLEITHAGPSRPGSLASRIANRARRALERGAGGLDDVERSLLLGLTVGDDRGQPGTLVQAFRASGLAHLLAVSGQNVAFVLALAGPVLRRLGPLARWGVVAAVLLLYGLMTRWEPSVLRASAMAAVTVTATVAGRPGTSLRTLALAVTAAVLVDPLVVRTVGFQLSVAATVGIVLLARPLALRLPGPRWLAEPFALTAAAQLGVAPVAVPVFGSLPLAALPANLLAGPAAGPLTAWGLTAGVIAGHLPGWSWLLHGPTRLLTGWLGLVAGLGAWLPLGTVRLPQLLGIAAGGAAVASVRWWRHRRSW